MLRPPPRNRRQYLPAIEHKVRSHRLLRCVSIPKSVATIEGQYQRRWDGIAAELVAKDGKSAGVFGICRHFPANM